jgi:hypothetical protein
MPQHEFIHLFTGSYNWYVDKKMATREAKARDFDHILPTVFRNANR